MNLYVYVTFDRDLKVFDQPFYAPIPVSDIKESYRNQFYHEAQKAYDAHLDRKTLFSLGEFDERKGEFIINKQELFDIDSILPAFVPSEEGVVNTLAREVAQILRNKFNGNQGNA